MSIVEVARLDKKDNSELDVNRGEEFQNNEQVEDEISFLNLFQISNLKKELDSWRVPLYQLYNNVIL